MVLAFWIAMIVCCAVSSEGLADETGERAPAPESPLQRMADAIQPGWHFGNVSGDDGGEMPRVLPCFDETGLADGANAESDSVCVTVSGQGANGSADGHDVSTAGDLSEAADGSHDGDGSAYGHVSFDEDGFSAGNLSEAADGSADENVSSAGSPEADADNVNETASGTATGAPRSETPAPDDHVLLWSVIITLALAALIGVMVYREVRG